MAGSQPAQRRARRDQLPPAHTPRSPARSWSAARPDGPPTPPADRPGRRRRPPCPLRRHTPADLAIRPGRRRGARAASSAMARRIPAEPQVGAATASPAGHRRPAPAPPTRPRGAQSPLRSRICPAQRFAARSGRDGSVHLGISPPVWTKHLLARCKLKSAIRISGLTSRACAAAPFLQGCIRMPGGPEWRNSIRVRHAADARAWHHPMPGGNRQLKDMANHGCRNNEAAA